MATDIDPVAAAAAEQEATRQRVRMLARDLQVAFTISTLSARRLARALIGGTVKFYDKVLDLTVEPDNELKADLAEVKLAKQRYKLRAWLEEADGLEPAWLEELVAQLKPGTTLIEWFQGCLLYTSPSPRD